MESREKQVGRFFLDLVLFKNEDGQLLFTFNSNNINMPNEMLITQLRTFTKILEDNHRQDFKGNIVNISGKPGE